MIRTILRRLYHAWLTLVRRWDLTLPPSRDVLIMLLFGAGGLLLYSGTAIAETAITGGAEAVSTRDVVEIMGLLLTFLISALTLAYSAGWLRQEVSDHRRRLHDVEKECRLARADAVQIAAEAAAKAAEIAAQAAEQNAVAAASLAAIRAQLDLLLEGRIAPPANGGGRTGS